MNPKFPIILSLYLLCQTFMFAQEERKHGKKIIQRQLISAQTGMPLPYVSIGTPGQPNTIMSDMAGFFNFSIDQNNDTIVFDRLSIKQKKISKLTLIESPIIELEELSFSLDDINVYPLSNDATIIMARVKENLKLNNPDLNTNYSCYIYNKMVFDIDTIKINKTNPTLEEFNTIKAYAQNNHLLLIESVTERKHALPDIDNEHIITGRVSGFKEPSLEFIPSQIHPFAFYNKYISLLKTDFLNPISSLGLKLYQFNLTDTTITSTGDTIFNIKYSPKNKLTFKGLVGSFQIESSSYAILKVEATGYADQTNNTINIVETFKKEENRLWFPSMLETRIQLGNVSYGKGISLPLLGHSRSYLTALNLYPEFKKEELSRIVLSQDYDYTASDSINLEQFRPIPLSIKESTSYTHIDSIGLANKFDQFTEWGRSLALGFIPAGYIKIDYTKIIDYNKREGWTLGAGLYTSPMVNKYFSLGGYIKHGFKDKKNKYGSSIESSIWPKHDAKAMLTYKNDVIPTNNVVFLDGYPQGSSESFKRFSLSKMDIYKRISAEIEARLLSDIKVNIFYSTQRSNSAETIFDAETNLRNSNTSSIKYYEIGTKLRWVYKEEFIKTALGKSPIPTSSPYVWINYSYLNGQSKDTNFDGHKLEGQIEKSFHTTSSGTTSLRLIAGTIMGHLPFSLYYSAFGTYSQVSLDVPYSLGTMRPNEFITNNFAMAFARHRIPLFFNSSRKFKPVIFLNTAAAFGEIKGYSSSSFEKGYYESGILLDNLFHVTFFKYGASVYYRYGPYHLPNEWDNWSAKISIEFSLGK